MVVETSKPAEEDEQVVGSEILEDDAGDDSPRQHELLNFEHVQVISLEDFQKVEPIAYDLIYKTGPSTIELSNDEDKNDQNSIFSIESVFGDADKKGKLQETPIDEYESALNKLKFYNGKSEPDDFKWIDVIFFLDDEQKDGETDKLEDKSVKGNLLN